MTSTQETHPMKPGLVKRLGVVAGVTLVAGLIVFLSTGYATPSANDGDKTQTETKETEETTKKAKSAADAKPVVKDVYVIQIKDHMFMPDTLVVPARKKIKLRIENLDKTPEEFESYDLNREKIVAGGRKIIVFVGPLKPGIYKYFGEFNPKTAQGVIIAK